MARQPLPYDGWYNGNIDLMINNGTYADFRSKLQERVDYKLMNPKVLEAADKKWEVIPLEKRKELRARVVDDSTPKQVSIETDTGRTVTKMSAKPSENNNVRPGKSKGPRKNDRAQIGRARGALTNDENPLDSVSEAAQPEAELVGNPLTANVS